MSTESGRSPTAPDPAVLAGALGRLPLAVVLVDAEGHAVWSNDVTASLAADHDDGLRRLLGAVEDAVAQHRPEDGCAVMASLPADRGLVERELWIGPVPGGGHLISFHPEITARTVAERAAVGHTARLEAMLEHTHDMVTVIDAEGTVQLSNAAAGRLTGFAGGSVNGTDAFSLVHPDDLGAAGAALAAVLAQPGVHPPVEVRIRFADGTWHDVVAPPQNLLAVPGVEGIVLSMHDVTDRRRAEAQAARSTAYLQSLIENLTDVIVVLDEDFNVLWTSPALATIIHAPVESNIGQSAFNDIHPDDLGPAITALTGVASGPLGGVTKIDLRLESRPGSGIWRWIEATAVNRLRDP
ncbi:MAG: PAS domain-containing protein, partial [Actinomycetota bacterium]|nr:PAS domain-containing protein [Actinomycetota bacterium]